jgi:hypothetical protein
MNTKIILNTAKKFKLFFKREKDQTYRYVYDNKCALERYLGINR